MEVYRFLSVSDTLVVILAVLLAAARGGLQSVSTILIGKVFTEYSHFTTGHLSRPHFMANALKLCTGLFTISGIMFLVGWALHFSWSVLGNLQGHRARQQLYHSFIYNEADEMQPADDLTGKMNMAYKDIQDLERAAGIDTCEILVVAFNGLVSTGVAMYYSWSITLISLCGIPVIIILLALVGPHMGSTINESKSNLAATSQRLTCTLSGLQTVKIFNKQHWEAARLEQQFNKARKLAVRFWRWSLLQEGFGRTLVLLMCMQTFFFGSYMVRKHGVTAGTVVIVFWSCMSAAASLQMFFAKLAEFQKGVVSAKRLNHTAVRPDGAKEFKARIGLIPQPSTAPSIEFQDVVFAYPGRQELVLQALNLSFGGGKTHYVLGKSGSGKSTIGSLLLNQHKLQAGLITIDGHSVNLLSMKWLHENIHLVEQNARLFDISLSDNIKIGSPDIATVSPALVHASIREMDAEFIYDLPDGLQTLGGSKLSGGQVQRILLARAWLSDAPVMVFDESTSALQVPLQKRLLRTLLRLRKDKTNIIITHSIELVGRNDPIHFMEDGQSTRYENLGDLLSDGRLASPDWSTGGAVEALRSSPKTFASELSDVTAEEPIKQSPAAIASARNSLAKVYEFNRLLGMVDNKPKLFLSLLPVCIHAAINPVFAFCFGKLLLGIFPHADTNITLWAVMVMLCAIMDGITTFAKISLHTFSEFWQQSARGYVTSQVMNMTDLTETQVSYYKKLILMDIEKAGEVVTVYWSALVSATLIGCIGLIWALALGWKLALVSISLMPLIIASGAAYKRTNAHFHRRREQYRVRVITLMEELVNSIGSIKAHGLEAFFEKHYMFRERQVWSVSFKSGIWLGLLEGIVEMFTPLVQGIVLFYGLKLASGGEYSGQQTMVVFSLVVFTLLTLDGLMKSISSVGQGFESVDRVNEAFKTLEPMPQMPIQKQIGVNNDFTILFRDFQLRFGNQPLFPPFTETVLPGTIVALCGPSGSGKTSIARAMLCLFPILPQQLFLGGRDITLIDPATVRENVTLVEQMPLKFFEGSIVENLLYGIPEVMDEKRSLLRAQEACQLVSIHDFVSGLEDGYDTPMRADEFSGGQLQRLGIARALVRMPRIILLDEPTSALDTANRNGIMGLLQMLRAQLGITIIIISHDPAVTKIADKQIQL